MEKQNITTIEELVERLFKDSIEHGKISGDFNGTHEVLRYAYSNYKKNGICDFDDYQFITGIIWGLYAVRFITKDEKNCLIDSLEM